MSAHFSLASPCYIVSDHHFGAVPQSEELAFIRFLEQIRGRAASLIINGDLFDFWFEWRSVVPRTGFRVLAALAGLAEAGVPIVWIGGNHDCWGGEVLRSDVGVEYMLGAWNGDIGGLRATVEHGDGLRPIEDKRYRALRAVIRHPLAIAGMRLLHPDLGVWLASRSSSASRGHLARDGGAGLRAIAHSKLTGASAPELYVLGHTHIPVLESVGAGIYANAGAWSEGRTYLVVTPQRVELCAFRDSAEEHRLDAIDRGA